MTDVTSVLCSIAHGDLDWIVMKALEKDRNRRYDTPGNFAEDIGRYLRREAILARPPSTAYKLKKFAQRNRTAVLTATAIATALLVGSVIATWQAVRATRAEAAALAALDEKEQARTAESKQRRLAEANEQKAILAAEAERKAKETTQARKPRCGLYSTSWRTRFSQPPGRRARKEDWAVR